jgi:hypothetical protein
MEIVTWLFLLVVAAGSVYSLYRKIKRTVTNVKNFLPLEAGVKAEALAGKKYQRI